MPVKIPYSEEELFGRNAVREYAGRQLDEIRFPIGGIGTGSISMAGWGQLRDFEIFNRPAKGLDFRHAMLALRVEEKSGKSAARVLQGPVGGTFNHHGSGIDNAGGVGLPHFAECTFEGQYPFGRLRLKDRAVPADVTLEAFNPFIPLNDKDSGIPCAIFLVRIRNPRKDPVKVSLYATLDNRVGHPEVGGTLTEYSRAGKARGLLMKTTRHHAKSPRFGTLGLYGVRGRAKARTGLTGHDRYGLRLLWDEIEAGTLSQNTEAHAAPDGAVDYGCVALNATVKPKETVTLPILITWHMPNFEKYWRVPEGQNPPVWRNWYATQWEDAADVAGYVAGNLKRLETETRAFADALWTSTLPAPVIDAVSSQISILKTTTCLRLPDGTFYGWEGCSPQSGCCEGSCTHVWNYAQALPYLFPQLQRSMREADYQYGMLEDGYVQFRVPLPLGTEPTRSFWPAADGQMGTVVQIYREWLISGDREWLARMWPMVKRALEYAWVHWDADRDGVMEGVQHNTYDIEFWGPNTMMGSLYLCALRAAAEMAEVMDETEKAHEYLALAEQGSEWSDEHLFNKDYYEQDVRVDAADSLDEEHRLKAEARGRDQHQPWPKFQIGKGCLSDQLIGQWYAEMLDLGQLYDAAHVRKALLSIFKHNWLDSLRAQPNSWRIYAVDDEAGLLTTTWPKGGRPSHPSLYSDEVWCGIEYQVAAHLIYEGMVAEGLAIVKGVRDRHDGTRRNPWNEFECGNHYARSMASYSLLLALSGFHYSAAARWIAFRPQVSPEDFRCFFSVEAGWGTFTQKQTKRRLTATIEVTRGELDLEAVELDAHGDLSSVRVELDGKELEATVENRGVLTVRLEKPVRVKARKELKIVVQS